MALILLPFYIRVWILSTQKLFDLKTSVTLGYFHIQTLKLLTVIHTPLGLASKMRGDSTDNTFL